MNYEKLKQEGIQIYIDTIKRILKSDKDTLKHFKSIRDTEHLLLILEEINNNGWDVMDLDIFVEDQKKWEQ